VGVAAAAPASEVHHQPKHLDNWAVRTNLLKEQADTNVVLQMLSGRGLASWRTSDATSGRCEQKGSGEEVIELSGHLLDAPIPFQGPACGERS
jgi:hypothetical protein